MRSAASMTKMRKINSKAAAIEKEPKPTNIVVNMLPINSAKNKYIYLVFSTWSLGSGNRRSNRSATAALCSLPLYGSPTLLTRMVLNLPERFRAAWTWSRRITTYPGSPPDLVTSLTVTEVGVLLR